MALTSLPSPVSAGLWQHGPEAESVSEPTPIDGTPPTIFLVDDDGAIRETMRMLLECDHRMVEAYSSAEAFLEAWRPGRDGCLVTDVHMPGLSGIELIERLAAGGNALPSIVITGFGDVRMAVRAMKAGAADFIEKPIRADELISTINRAYARCRDHARIETSRNAATTRLAGLTERQHQIMEMILTGNPNKNIAADLGISQRTVENHRAAIMKKTQSKSVPALARLALGVVA